MENSNIVDPDPMDPKISVLLDPDPYFCYYGFKGMSEHVQYFMIITVWLVGTYLITKISRENQDQPGLQ